MHIFTYVDISKKMNTFALILYLKFSEKGKFLLK